MLIETFVPEYRFGGGMFSVQGSVMFGAYSLGILVAGLVAWLLKSTILRGPRSLFVLELPSYKLPSVRLVLAQIWDRGGAFVRRAGTLIVSVSILVWAAAYFPHDPKVAEAARKELAAQQPPPSDRQVADAVSGAYLRQSWLGRTGRALEPLFRPLGWDWRIGCAVIASFPAREVVIGVMGVLYNLGKGEDESSVSLRARLHEVTWEGTNKRVYNLPVAMSLVVFFALCAQCAATLVVIRRETNRWTWPVFTFVYMTSLAYVGAWITYRIMSSWGW
jgi:ferrous iron transport protein B